MLAVVFLKLRYGLVNMKKHFCLITSVLFVYNSITPAFSGKFDSLTPISDPLDTAAGVRSLPTEPPEQDSSSEFSTYYYETTDGAVVSTSSNDIPLHAPPPCGRLYCPVCKSAPPIVPKEWLRRSEFTLDEEEGASLTEDPRPNCWHKISSKGRQVRTHLRNHWRWYVLCGTFVTLSGIIGGLSAKKWR